MLEIKLKKILLVVVTLCFTQLVFAQKKFTVLSYNILIGMERDTTKGKSDFVAWIKSYDLDILALQEANKFTQKSLEELARTYNHPYAVLLKENGYPVALTSKTPIINVHRVIDNMHHGFIVAETHNYNILVLHLSPHKYWKRREEIDVILQTIAAQPSKKRWIVMGDFNSLSPLDKDKYADGSQVKRYQDAAKKYNFHENLVDGKYIDFNVQQKILDFGLIDAVKEYSKKSSAANDALNKERARIDYIYVSKDLASKVMNAKFLYDDFTRTHSDHRPVLMELRNKN